MTSRKMNNVRKSKELREDVFCDRKKTRTEHKRLREEMTGNRSENCKSYWTKQNRNVNLFYAQLILLILFSAFCFFSLVLCWHFCWCIFPFLFSFALVKILFYLSQWHNWHSDFIRRFLLHFHWCCCFCCLSMTKAKINKWHWSTQYAEALICCCWCQTEMNETFFCFACVLKIACSTS